MCCDVHHNNVLLRRQGSVFNSTTQYKILVNSIPAGTNLGIFLNPLSFRRDRDGRTVATSEISISVINTSNYPTGFAIEKVRPRWFAGHKCPFILWIHIRRTGRFTTELIMNIGSRITSTFCVKPILCLESGPLF